MPRPPRQANPFKLAYARRGMLHSLALVLQWVLDPLNLVDLVAVAPYYVQFFTDSSGVQLTFVRVLRLQPRSDMRSAFCDFNAINGVD